MTNSNFTHNDGGREASGRKGTAGDCGVRAMAIALDLSYEECYRELAQANKDAGGKKSARNGLSKTVYEKVLNKHGWFWQAAPKFDGRKCKAKDLYGVCIARMAGHYCAVIEGVPHDIFDCSNKMVYGVWVHALNH
jgi:hypothetical protein